MEKKLLLNRIIVIAVVFVFICLVYVFKLMEYQLVRGDEFLEQATNTITIKVPITAARGEIVDRYGRKIATNRVGYNIQLNKLYLPNEKLNDTILNLIYILENNGETHIDFIPLTKQQPYEFLQESEKEISKIKAMLGLAEYSTAQNVWDKMVQRYKLQDIPLEYQRRVAGVRCEMELREYSEVTPYTLATDVSMKTVNTIKERSLSLLGVEIVEQSIRYYPDGTLMPHVIGSVGPIYAEEWQELKTLGYNMNDIIGKSGLEKAYEQELKGIDGIMEVERAKDGTIISTRVTKEPNPGKTLVLTIDLKLQQAAQKALADQIEYIEVKDKEGGEGAALVVTDTKDGGILACATHPSYDMNLYSEYYSEYLNMPNTPLFNRALNGQYRPGSAFKTVVGLTGLLENEIQQDSLINCTGTYGYYADVGFTPSCLMHGHSGPINVERALQDSCNIFFYELGRRLGYEKFNSVAQSLGLATKTGVEIPESIGNMSTPEQRHNIILKQLENGMPPSMTSEEWQAGNVVQAAIGQMDTSVTPLQLSVYGAALANRGVRYKSHFVKSIVNYDYDSSKTQEIEPVILGEIQDVNDAFKIVENGMVRASFYGTVADSLKDYPYTIATKTGTAQVKLNKFNATMVAYGPVENPEIAIGIVVENCGNSYRLANSVKSIFDAYYFSKADAMLPAEYNTLLH